MTDRPDMTNLPDHIRDLVEEIEREMGEGRSLGADIDGRESLHGEAGLPDDGSIESAVRKILVEIGEDPDRQGLLGTPARVHRMYAELTAGYDLFGGLAAQGVGARLANVRNGVERPVPRAQPGAADGRSSTSST